MERAQDTRRLTAPPAVAMLVVALATLATHVFGLLFGDPGAGIAETAERLEETLRVQYGPEYELDRGLVTTLYWIFEAGVFAGGLAVVAGAALMLSQRAWWAGLVAAILMLTPCLWPCCCPLGAGVGVWALVILARADVRAVFRGQGAPAAPAAFTVPPPPPPEPPSEGGGDWGSGT